MVAVVEVGAAVVAYGAEAVVACLGAAVAAYGAEAVVACLGAAVVACGAEAVVIAFYLFRFVATGVKTACTAS